MPRACPVELHVRGYFSCEREPPRDKPVASRQNFFKLACSGYRENSTGQARGIQAEFF
jgi:hypothetical protein